jgi:hypothetical protein
VDKADEAEGFIIENMELDQDGVGFAFESMPLRV